ncbi:cyclin-dependent protein kinase inhibitor SMR6 [Cicer arietinum]|uniref:Cyclin-dependent protein kinase inhibitor SMR6 n=1 Tax=Cicer arietinum TaxID=3827 RepID=A0A1S2XH11_CICAR|nr:cyclin-dependent protein kinase inhibitor SMR6 [Cicer arietinum]
MGFSKKTQIENSLESEAKKWVIAGISVRSLKPINTKVNPKNDVVFDEEDEECSTTPTAKEARIPVNLSCPPAPMKKRISRCNNVGGGGVREFFTTPDLETVFKRYVEKSL